MIHVSQGDLSRPIPQEQPLTDSFVEHIDKCLDCRACETACPSGVEYGKLVEHARARVERDFPRPFFSRLVRNFVFKKLLPSPRALATTAKLIRFYQRSGLQTVARGSGLLKLFGLADREQLLPSVNDHFFFDKLGHTFPAIGVQRARVAFFAGCVANIAFVQLNEATIRVLTANGCEVCVPAGQLCCGALSTHAGFRDTARDLARKNLRAFQLGNFDAIVTNAAGCGSTLKEYNRLFTADEPEYAAAVAFGNRVGDVTEFLAAIGIAAPLQPVNARVTYQDSCHLLHGQKIREAPRQLLRAIPGLKLVELPYSEICCGSAGTYNITQPQASLALLADKMHHAQSTGAEIIATANPGCLLQLRAGVRLHKTGQEVAHVIELLERALPFPVTATAARKQFEPSGVRASAPGASS
jgi:glycolate oxidase iron-sulfur subunit